MDAANQYLEEECREGGRSMRGLYVKLAWNVVETKETDKSMENAR